MTERKTNLFCSDSGEDSSSQHLSEGLYLVPSLSLLSDIITFLIIKSFQVFIPFELGGGEGGGDGGGFVGRFSFFHKL